MFQTVKMLQALILVPAFAFCTAMGDLAATLQPGTWAELSCSNITPTLDNLSGASGMTTVYCDDMVWNPGTEQAFHIGADHLASQGPQFACYTASSNAWARLSRPTWLSSLTFFHGYDHSAIDAANGILYHRPYSQNRVHRYNIGTQTWTELPTGSSTNCCDALEYFPERDGLVWVSGYGTVSLYKPSTNQWSSIATLQAGSTWQQAEYSPVHKVMLFSIGGRFYKLAATGAPVQLPTPPISLYDGSGYNGVLTVDPVSGTFLILTPTSRQFYTFDPATDTWQAQSSTNKPNLNNLGVIATPVSTYGVTYFAACSRGNCHAYIYKHTASNGTETPAPAQTLNVTVSPNPFKGTVKIAVSGQRIADGKIGIVIYDIKGKIVYRLSATSYQLSAGISWNASGFPAGIYLLRTQWENQTRVKRIFLLK